jgi:hypothetical protein
MFVAITGRVTLVLVPRLAAVTLITGALVIGTLGAGAFVITRVAGTLVAGAVVITLVAGTLVASAVVIALVIGILVAGAFVIGSPVADIAAFVLLATVVDAVSVLVVAGWWRSVIAVAVAGGVTISIVGARLVIRSIVIVWRVAPAVAPVVVAVRRAVICGVVGVAIVFRVRIVALGAGNIRSFVRDWRIRFDVRHLRRRIRYTIVLVRHRWECPGCFVGRARRFVQRARSLEYAARVRRSLARAHCRTITEDKHHWLRLGRRGCVL